MATTEEEEKRRGALVKVNLYSQMAADGRRREGTRKC